MDAGNDLGAVYERRKRPLRWAPTAEKVMLCIVHSGKHRRSRRERTSSGGNEKGTGNLRKTGEGDLHGVYYTFSVTVDGKPEKPEISMQRGRCNGKRRYGSRFGKD